MIVGIMGEQQVEERRVYTKMKCMIRVWTSVEGGVWDEIWRRIITHGGNSAKVSRKGQESLVIEQDDVKLFIIQI